MGSMVIVNKPNILSIIKFRGLELSAPRTEVKGAAELFQSLMNDYPDNYITDSLLVYQTFLISNNKLTLF